MTFRKFLHSNLLGLRDHWRTGLIHFFLLPMKIVCSKSNSQFCPNDAQETGNHYISLIALLYFASFKMPYRRLQTIQLNLTWPHSRDCTGHQSKPGAAASKASVRIEDPSHLLLGSRSWAYSLSPSYTQSWIRHLKKCPFNIYKAKTQTRGWLFPPYKLKSVLRSLPKLSFPNSK